MIIWEGIEPGKFRTLKYIKAKNAHDLFFKLDTWFPNDEREQDYFYRNLLVEFLEKKDPDFSYFRKEMDNASSNSDFIKEESFFVLQTQYMYDNINNLSEPEVIELIKFAGEVKDPKIYYVDDEGNELQQNNKEKETTVISIEGNAVGLGFLQLALSYLNDVKLIIKNHQEEHEEQRNDIKKDLEIAKLLSDNLTLDESPENNGKLSIKYGSLSSETIDAVIDAVISDFEYVESALENPEKANSEEVIRKFNHGKALLKAVESSSNY